MKTWHFCNFYFFYFITIGIIVPYWSLYLQHLGFSATEIGQLMAILLITKIIAPNIWATVADNIALKKGSSLGILKFAVGATLLIYCQLYWVNDFSISDANPFWLVAIIMFAYCIFWNACLPQLEAATLNHLHDDRDQYGKIRLWGSIGFIFSVSAIGMVMDQTGAAVILPAGAAGLFSLFIASLLLTGKRGLPIPAMAPVDSAKIALSKLLNIRVIVLLVLCFFMQLTHAPFYTFFSIYLEGYGYSKFQIGLLWSVGVVFEVIVFLVGYRLLRYYSLTWLLIFSFAVAAVRWCLVAEFPDNGNIIFISQVMHAITYGLYHMVMIQMIDRLFKGRYQIRGQALYSSITFGLGGAVGSIGSGYIWTYYGAEILFLSAGFIMVIVAVLSLVLVKFDLAGHSHRIT